MEIYYRSVNKGQSIILEGRELWRIDGTTYRDKLGTGTYAVRITDESGKIDLNTLTDASGILLKNLLIQLGVSGEDADVIVDSILDWKDPDNLVRLHGAEDEYYMALPKPYKAKNADFETLEELLLVRGITSGIFYGTENHRGLVQFRDHLQQNTAHQHCVGIEGGTGRAPEYDAGSGGPDHRAPKHRCSS